MSLLSVFKAMTTLKVNLPDDLAQRAKDAGLLNDDAIKQLLETAVRREAGRQLLGLADKLRAENIPPMTDEEIVAEVKAVRAERKARNAGRS
jgi:post-segregation antitoxin (ccd killing protein)